MKKPTKSQRKQLMAELSAILTAQEWPEEAMPVDFYLTKATWQRSDQTWWGVLRARGNCSAIGGYAAIEFSKTPPQSQTVRIVRRLKKWSEAAWEAGVRRVRVTHQVLPSAHEAIAAEAIAQQFDQILPDEIDGGVS